jgi:hypothetical protein
MTRLTLPTAHIATLLRALTRDRDQLAAAGDDAEAQVVQAVIYAVEPQVVDEPVRSGDVWRCRLGNDGCRVVAVGDRFAVLRAGDAVFNTLRETMPQHYVLIERDGVPVAQEASHV